MHLIAPDGRIWRGATAAREVLALLPRWRWAAYLMRVPGVLAVAERVYDWIARRRHSMPCGSAVCRRGKA
jgi:predicted DCC family thiol-disulfide oxidoreductase YuxK